MARALLGNGQVNTPATEFTQDNNGRCISVEECYCALLSNSAAMKTVAGNHVTYSLCGFRHATVELFSVLGPCGGYITRITPAVQFNDRGPVYIVCAILTCKM
jgi:hypothetical protein